MSERKHSLATQLRGQITIEPTPFSSWLPPGTTYGRVRNRSYWVGEELVSKIKPTTNPSPITGFQTQRNADLGWRERIQVDMNLYFSLFHWTRQLHYWNETALLMGILWDSLKISPQRWKELVSHKAEISEWEEWSFFFFILGNQLVIKWLHIFSIFALFYFCLLFWLLILNAGSDHSVVWNYHFELFPPQAQNKKGNSA